MSKCSVCPYPNVGQVNRAIINGMNYRMIAKRFPPLSRASIWRHGRNCLKFDSHRAVREKRIGQVVDVYNEMVEQFQFAKGLRLACQEYLSDPNDPLKINFSPRVDEIEVIYFEADSSTNGRGRGAVKPIKKSATLDQLLAQVQDVMPDVRLQSLRPRIKIDMRRYALEAIHTVNLVLDKFARLEGLYTKDRENETAIERAVMGLQLFIEKNPEATEEEIREAISIVARGVSISESVLTERLGITFEIEEVQ